MTQKSFLEALCEVLLAFMTSATPILLPHLIFSIAVLWLAVVGWKRQRVRGFLLLLVASIFELVSALMFIAQGFDNPSAPPGAVDLSLIALRLNNIAEIFAAAGIWHFVYRARFAPPEPTPQ